MHASSVLVGDRAVLIRGPSGSGKSRLAFDLILAGRAGQISETTLIGDDRVQLEVRTDRLFVRPVEQLAGLIEIRGLGIRRCAFTAEGVVALVVDLSADDADRHPPSDAVSTTISGIELARIPVAAGYPPLPLVLAALSTSPITNR